MVSSLDLPVLLLFFIRQFLFRILLTVRFALPTSLENKNTERIQKIEGLGYFTRKFAYLLSCREILDESYTFLRSSRETSIDATTRKIIIENSYSLLIGKHQIALVVFTIFWQCLFFYDSWISKTVIILKSLENIKLFQSYVVIIIFCPWIFLFFIVTKS